MLVILVLPAAGIAAEPVLEFDIASGRADYGLTRYAEQSGRQVLFPFDLVRQYRTNAVRGRYTADAAMERLLRGSGLEATSDEQGTLIIRKASTEEGEMAMEEKGTLRRLAAVIAAVLAAPAAHSQDTHPASSVVEELVVTAQKREQSIQDVSMSISAFSGDAVRDLGFQSAIDIVNQVPNLALRDVGTVPILTLRGNSIIDFGDGNESPVGFYVDEVYRSTLAGQQNQIYDIERVEVLRGPQGTLYGRNTTAGLVHFISRKPTDELDGYLDFQYGSFNQRILEGALGGPLGDRMRGRVSFKYNEDEGWQENLGSGGGDAAVTDVVAVRAQLAVDITEDAELLLGGSYMDQDNVSNIYGFQGVLDPNTFLQCTPAQVNARQCVNLAGFRDTEGDPEEIYSELHEPENSVETTDFSAKLTWDIADNLQLVSITSWLDLDRRLEVDEDASATGAFGGFLQFFDIYTVETETVTQEIRLSGRFQDRFDWVAGFFYFDDTKEPTSTVTDLEFPPGVPDTQAKLDTTSWAVFGHVNAQLTDQWGFTAGIRYTEDDKDAVITTAGQTGTRSVSANAVTGELGLNWRPVDDLMLYASFARGFKSPEVNTTLLFGDLTAATAADEEIVLAYELGAKWEFWDGRGRLSAAAFYQDITDKQGVVIPGASPVPAARLINFGDADIYGAELELFMQPTPQLEVVFGMSLLDTEIEADPATGILAGWGAGANGGLGDFYPMDGSKLPQAAEITFNGIVRYHVPLGNYGDGTLQVDFSWTDDQPTLVPYNEIESYGLVNLRAFWESPSGRYHASAFVENVFDEEVELNRFFLGGFDYQAIIWGKPRWAGFRVGIRL